MMDATGFSVIDRSIVPGKDLGVRDLVLDAQLVDRYVETLGLRHRWYSSESPWGGHIAPLAALYEAEAGFDGNHFANRFGELWIRQEWEFLKAVQLGDRLRVAAVVKDVYKRKDRTVVATAYTMTSTLGRTVARSVHHNSFLVDQQGGEVRLPDPKDRKRAKQRSEPEGESIGELATTITLAMCDAFYSGDENYHTDPTAAAELGFSDVVIGAGMTTAYIFELMVERFGRGWLEGGRADLKFINVLNPDEQFSSTGVITGRTKEWEGLGRTHTTVWSAKADGTKIIVGEASALDVS